MKKCTKCKIDKPLSEYYQKGGRLRSDCKACGLIGRKVYLQRPEIRERQKAHRRKFKYGLTEDEYQTMRQKQDGKCAACRCDLTGGLEEHVDHCHVSKQVRGILCRNCNLTLGHANEDRERLLALVAYLDTTDLGSRPSS